MGLSSELVSQFVNVTKDTEKTKNESIVYGTIVYDGKLYVKLDGSDLLTPITTTADVKDGERVTVMIKNHTATVTGNVSSPSARTDDVKEIGSQITEFEVIMAYQITAEDVEATNATIDSLYTKIATLESASVGDFTAIKADIENLKANVVAGKSVSANELTAINAQIESIEAQFGEFTNISAEDLEAINADITNLKSYTADFVYVSAEVLQAIRGDIKNLDVKYANVDFSNIGSAAIEEFFSKSGMVENIVVGEGTITGKLVGVTISGDLIEGNTVKADKLVVLGEDGLYYKLNVNALGETTASSDEKYQNGLDGSVIIAKSITADRVSVTDLVAFGATIGGFNITENSLYSGVKQSVGNTTRGVYLDNEGQIAFGDSSNFIRYFKDTDGSYKLEISAKTIKLGASSKNVEEIATNAEQAAKDVNDLKDRMDSGEFKGEDATLLRIESSRGTVFKNDHVATVLSVVIYHGTQRITDSTTMKTVFGNSAYLQWKWQHLDDDSFGIISAGDSRFGDNGFTFTLSPEDVDTKVTFMCELIT